MKTLVSPIHWDVNQLHAQPLSVTSPAPRDVWQNLINSDPEALVTQTPAWIDCICALGGYEDASRLYETPQGRQLILPMVRQTGLPAALTTEASPPHGWGIGGLVGDGAVGVKEPHGAFMRTNRLNHAKNGVQLGFTQENLVTVFLLVLFPLAALAVALPIQCLAGDDAKAVAVTEKNVVSDGADVERLRCLSRELARNVATVKERRTVAD